mmetsp:Transcript_20638/g.45526  ORF Transcript_20638/g.45526 Transcript_20638/m.45526 type:complete len:110 (+) Transcript_20638:743-1072(+)
MKEIADRIVKSTYIHSTEKNKDSDKKPNTLFFNEIQPQHYESFQNSMDIEKLASWMKNKNLLTVRYREMIEFIFMELKRPFASNRPAAQDLTGWDLFYKLTGESTESFF